MLEAILPREVVVAEVFGDEHDDGELLAQEEAALVRASPKRRAEYTAVRVCAREALARAGFPPAAVLPGPSGAPIWPAGIVGSMTHCAGYRACAIARADEIAALGVDAEPHVPLPDGVLPLVATESERTALGLLTAAGPGVCWETILFSAKESVYKAWFPATGAWLGFAQADVEIDAGGTFTARLEVPGPMVGGRRLDAYQGRWLVERGLVATAVTVRADGADRAGQQRT